jgi:hypothetical protein
LVVGVDESAVDVEDRGVCHGPCLPRRKIVMRCGGESLAAAAHHITTGHALAVKVPEAS